MWFTFEEGHADFAACKGRTPTAPDFFHAPSDQL
jgi:hypothetical protein